MIDDKLPNMNPKFPDKLYSGLSVEEYIKQYCDRLTAAQIAVLRIMRTDGKLY